MSEDEKKRLSLVHEIQRLRSSPDASFDALTKMASKTCGQPMSLVSLVEETRQVFVSRQGLQPSETPREVSFCAHAIRDCSNTEVFQVKDTHLDPRFHDNDLVVNDPWLRFYAGVPLAPLDAEHPVGTLCVLGTEPGELTAQQLDELIELANITEQLMRLSLRSAAEQELTERLEASEQQLRETQARRAHVARTIAHDLTTPLAAIRITSESLRQQEPPEPLAGQVDNLIAYARDAESMVRDLRVVNSINGADAPKLSLTEQPIAPLVERSALELFGSADADVVDLDLRDVAGHVDEHAFTRIVTNLITNAVIHNPSDTRVAIRLDLEDDHVVLEVSDNGIGIPAEDRRRMLEPYEALGESGSGLGLAIVDTLATAHGGAISIEGNDPTGTIVTVTIPTSSTAALAV